MRAGLASYEASGGSLEAAADRIGIVALEGSGLEPHCRRTATMPLAVFDLLAGDLAHGVVEGKAQDLDEEVDGVSGQIALGPTPVTVFDEQALVGGQLEVAGLQLDELKAALLEQGNQRSHAYKCQSSLLTLVGGGDNLLPCRANCALSILGRVGASHYGSERQATGEQKAERTVMEEMKRLDWEKGDLQRRRKGEGGDGAPTEERNDHELEVDSTEAADGQLDLCLKPSA